MVLLRAELVTHLPTKDVTLNVDMLAAQSKHKRFGVSRLTVSKLPPETNTEPGSEIQYTPCPLGSEL